MSDLKKEFKYYLDHKDDLVKEYNGKVVVIKDQKVIGVYDTEIEAIEKTYKDHEVGTFLVQKCEAGDQDHTMYFHSRVTFA